MNDLILWEQQSVDFGTETEIIVYDRELAADAEENGVPVVFSDTPVHVSEYEDIGESDFTAESDAMDRLDYTAAAACGIISAALDILWLGKINVSDAVAFGAEQLGKLAVTVSRLIGYHGSSPEEAVERLAAVCGSPIKDESGFSDFACQPSAAGLCFSVLSQLTGKIYGTDGNGSLSFKDMPDSFNKEKSNPEKILSGILSWAIASGRSMAADRNIQHAKGVPDSISSIIRDISQTSAFTGKSSVQTNVCELTESLLGESFSLQKELGVQNELVKLSMSVLINECLVRGFYMLRRLLIEIKSRNIRSVSDLARIESARFLPYNNRVITRMLTVSSGTFVAVTSAKAAICAAKSLKGGWQGAVVDFAVHINYAGLASFVICCKTDGAYTIADARRLYSEMLAWKRLMKQEEQDMFRSFARMRLNDEQQRLLDCLKRHKLLYDIRASKSLKETEKKQSWLMAWEDDICRQRGVKEDEYLIDDEDSIYDVINEKTETEGQSGEAVPLWLYIMATELKLFAPYSGLEMSEKTGGLILRNNYETEIFCTRQSVISAEELEEIMHLIEAYVGKLSASEGQKNAGIAATAILTGGVSLLPMAIAKSRGVDVDRAVRNAAASVNTNVIRSSGQIAGMFGNAGSAIFAGSLSIPYECAKILAVCEHVIKGRNNDIQTVQNINRYFYEQIVSIESKAASYGMDGGKKTDSRKRIQRLESYLKYFIKCRDILDEMCENW